MNYKAQKLIAARKRRIFFDRLKTNIILSGIFFGLMFALYLTQAKRLAAYEQTRLCLYQNWDHDFCQNQANSKIK